MGIYRRARRALFASGPNCTAQKLEENRRRCEKRIPLDPCEPLR